MFFFFFFFFFNHGAIWTMFVAHGIFENVGKL